MRELVPGGRELNEESWQVARKPGRSSEDYQLAVRTAELAVRLEPTMASWVHTLGVAQYRGGQYEESRATLERAMALSDGLASTAEVRTQIESSSFGMG